MSPRISPRKRAYLRRKRFHFWLKIGFLVLLCCSVLLTYPGLTGHHLPTWETVFRACGFSTTADSSHPLRITMCDVGAADCLLLSCEETQILIDTGTSESSDAVYNLLTREKVTELDLVLLTHPHSDHIGGAEKLFAKYPPEKILYSGNPAPISFPEESSATAVSAGDRFSLGNITLEILSTGLPDAEDSNDTSIVAKITYGNFSLLCMGDASVEVEADLLAREHLSPVTVLKVGHHGSNTATSEEFLEVVSPRHALISCGSTLPAHQLVLNRLRQRSISYSRTDLDGDITLTTDGDHIAIYHEK